MPSSAPALTKREQEVLELMALGLASKEIARRLSLSTRTVETHVNHVLHKLNAKSRTRAIIAAGEAGLLGGAPVGESDHVSSAPTGVRAQRLVGRRRELASLNDRLTAMIEGKGSLVTLGGEAGSGKSRLIDEFCRTIPAGEARFAVGQCFEYAQSPLAPFLAILSALSAQTPNVLRGSIPLIAAQEKLDQFNMLAQAFVRLGGARPAVIVLEDAQWADSASLDLLLHLAPLLESSRLLILVTHRTELERGNPLRGVLTKLARNRNMAHIMFSPLTGAEINMLLADALGDRTPPPAETINAICVHSEGNPLLAEELLKTVLESDRGANRIPTTLGEAVLDRLNSLDESDRTVLIHAAAIGRRFDAQFVSDVTDNNTSATLAALKRAIELQLIVEEPGDTASFAFKHELTRQAIYGELLVAQARPLHHRVAVALESGAGGDRVAELAYHYWLARDLDKAADYNERAGDNAVALFAYRDAIANYERAISTGVPNPLHHALLQEKLASALFSAGHGERAIRVSQNVLGAYERAGETKRAAAVCLALAQTMALLGDTPQHEHYIQRALQLIANDTTDPVFFDAHLALMSYYAQWRWEPRRALEHARIAESAQGSATLTSQIRFYEMRMLIHLGLGNTAEANADAQRAVASATESGEWRSVLRIWANYAGAMAQTGERACALEGSTRALQIIKDKRITGMTPVWTLVELALVRTTHGDLSGAALLIEQSRAEVIDFPSFRLRLARAAIQLGIALGDEPLTRCARRRELIEFALRSNNVEIMSSSLSAFAELAFAHGKRSEGIELLRRALDGLEAVDAHPPAGDIEELLLLVAQRSDRADVERARKFLERIVSSSSVRATPPYLALFEAYEQIRFGQRTRGIERAHDAVELFQTIGWPLHEARALEAASRPRQALEVFKQVGAVGDVRRLEVALTINRRDQAKTEMTRREREIHELVVQGNTNKAIAATLSLSERTVETHVTSILAKLGAASRAELVAKLRPGR